VTSTADAIGFGFIPDARTMALEPTGGPARVLSGDPATAEYVFERSEHLAVGVWEVQPGSWESRRGAGERECVVILSGRGTVRLQGGDVIDLRPGAVVEFPPAAGLVWDVTEPLRKVYVLANETPEGDDDATA
jgi:uncharacterized cupin superfamily protein